MKTLKFPICVTSLRSRVKKTRRELIEGEDFYYDKGLKVLTEKFLLRRGKCCHHSCRHCPWKKVDKKQETI